MFPYKTEHRLYTGKVTFHLSDYLYRKGGYRENGGESLSCGDAYIDIRILKQ